MKIKDNTGNELLIHERGVNLILASDKVERRIFQVQGGQLVKYVKPQNIMNAGKKIGFNYKALQVIREWLRKKYMFIILGKKRYKLPIDEVIENGEFLYFKKEGFELQIFYPVKGLDKYKMGG